MQDLYEMLPCVAEHMAKEERRLFPKNIKHNQSEKLSRLIIADAHISEIFGLDYVH